MTPEFLQVQGKGAEGSDSSLQFIMVQGPPRTFKKKKNLYGQPAVEHNDSSFPRETTVRNEGTGSQRRSA